MKKSLIYISRCVVDFIYNIVPISYFKNPIDPTYGNFKFLKGKGIGFSIIKPKNIPKNVLFRQVDFLNEKLIGWKEFNPSIVLCNPLFKHEKYLELIIKRWNKTVPIVMIVPIDFRNNHYKRSKKWKWLRDNKGTITSIISLPYCNNEILCFNIPKLNPHYWILEKYLI